MKSRCWFGTTEVRVETVPAPGIANPRDAIIRITANAIRASELRISGGSIPTLEKGDIPRHEFMGDVVEVGSGVGNLKAGNRIVVRFSRHNSPRPGRRRW